MSCIVLVRCVLVLRCGLAVVVWYPYAGWSKWHQVGLSLFNYQDDARSNKHKMSEYLRSFTVHVDNMKFFICPTNAHKSYKIVKLLKSFKITILTVYKSYKNYKMILNDFNILTIL